MPRRTSQISLLSCAQLGKTGRHGELVERDEESVTAKLAAEGGQG